MLGQQAEHLTVSLCDLRARIESHALQRPQRRPIPPGPQRGPVVYSAESVKRLPDGSASRVSSASVPALSPVADSYRSNAPATASAERIRSSKCRRPAVPAGAAERLCPADVHCDPWGKLPPACMSAIPKRGSDAFGIKPSTSGRSRQNARCRPRADGCDRPGAGRQRLSKVPVGEVGDDLFQVKVVHGAAKLSLAVDHHRTTVAEGVVAETVECLEAQLKCDPVGIIEVRAQCMMWSVGACG